MDKTILLAFCIVAVVGLCFSAVIAIQFYGEKEAALQRIGNLYDTIDEKQETIDDLYGTIEDKQDDILELSDQKNSLTYQNNQLTSQNTELTNTLAAVTLERDQAIRDAESRQNELDYLYANTSAEKQNIIVDLESQIQEVRNELAEIDWYNKQLMAQHEEVINRTTVIEGEVYNTGVEIVVSGLLVNTGLNYVDSIIYFEAWDLMDEKCVNITTNIVGQIGELTYLAPTQHKEINCRLNYSPNSLTRYKVSVITGNKIYEIT
ncbi:MAG: hypothetical protein CW716_00560 [Candidatus Bathyarchaeum sp.]|nr:MAG: hypothetical protein CW716_00560 [Candidatus Bathyarchaeum sp.]